MCDPDGEPSDSDDDDSNEADDKDECGDVEAAAAMPWSLLKDTVGNILDYLPFM